MAITKLYLIGDIHRLFIILMVNGMWTGYIVKKVTLCFCIKVNHQKRQSPTHIKITKIRKRYDRLNHLLCVLLLGRIRMGV